MTDVFASGKIGTDISPRHGVVKQKNVFMSLKKVDVKSVNWTGNTGTQLSLKVLNYANLKALQKQLDEMCTYIRNNQMMIPNYGEMR